MLLVHQCIRLCGARRLTAEPGTRAQVCTNNIHTNTPIMRSPAIHHTIQPLHHWLPCFQSGVSMKLSACGMTFDPNKSLALHVCTLICSFDKEGTEIYTYCKTHLSWNNSYNAGCVTLCSDKLQEMILYLLHITDHKLQQPSDLPTWPVWHIAAGETNSLK